MTHPSHNPPRRRRHAHPRTAPLAVTLAACLLALPACNNVNRVQRADPVGAPTYVKDRRIVTDPILGNDLRVRSVIESTVSDDLLQIQVFVENTQSRKLRFNYKFEWFDIHGMQLRTPTSIWKPKELLGRETSTLAAVAPTPTAKDFVLKVVNPED